MAVFRVNKTKDYTIMSNYHLKDKNLSLKAKGLLSIMLSLPEDWDYSIGGLVAICEEGETSIKSALNELKNNGYLVVTKLMPNETKNGRYDYIYDIYEKKQEGRKQGVENLEVEFQEVEKHHLNKYTKELNTKELNIDNQSSDCDDFDEILKTIQEKIKMNLNSIDYERINNLISKYKKEDILNAIDKSYQAGAKTIQYIEQVLNNKSKNIQNSKPNANNQYNKFKEPIHPAWMDEDIQEDKMTPEEVEEFKKEINWNW